MQMTPRVIGPDALARIIAVVEQHVPGKNLLLVCDDLTWNAAGHLVLEKLGEEYKATRHSLGRDIHPTLALAEEVIAVGGAYDALLAVGSGSINDITKYAAAQLKKPYICIATAASMNGYTSANASLLVDGYKQSLPAVAPIAVIADINVIAHAPRRLARSGLGDTLCRSTVEADMILSHYLLGTPYPKAIFDRLRAHESTLIPNAGKLTSLDTDMAYFTALMEALLDGGDAMTEYGSSAVASQGEHMIANAAELMYGSDIHSVRHGELVAVASVSVSKLQEHMLLGQPIVKSLPRNSSQFLRLFGKHSADAVEAAYHKKLLNPEQAQKINSQMEEIWPRCKEAIQEILLPSTTLQRALTLAGTPTRAQDIRLDPERYQNILTYAHMTRERFSFLDLAVMNDKRA